MTFKDLIEKSCFALMYVNHLFSFYADYTHYRTSFCKGNECIEQYYPDKSDDESIDEKCIQCNDTYFDTMIMPFNLVESRNLILKSTSIFFTLESVCYLMYTIGIKFNYRYFIKIGFFYTIICLIAFLIIGFKFSNLVLSPTNQLINFRNFYLLTRLFTIYISIDYLFAEKLK